ncbi:hypothetical protein [Dactylococcopsis salina]|uniref:hypothetical protein n=1 Tax=Dactylococcopsis salina TaxID=292566 RepID=UPI0002D7A222|nr:hypothetical protein [Dactylococcopsis salina]
MYQRISARSLLLPKHLIAPSLSFPFIQIRDRALLPKTLDRALPFLSVYSLQKTATTLNLLYDFT